MSVINGLLLSGWFQLMLLSSIFVAYSSRILRRQVYRGYALGWMVGLFFIFVYAAIKPTPALQFGAYDSELNVLQIFVAGAGGLFVSLTLSTIAYLFRTNRIQLALITATVTGIFVIAIFLQVVAEPDVRVMISLFVLAFGMTALTTNIIMSRRLDSRPMEVAQEPESRLDIIRERIVERNNFNMSAKYPR
jgi:hypothetical protein